MELIKNITQDKYGIRGEIYFKLFDRYIALSSEDNDIAYAEQCATYLNALPETVIITLCEASIRYCSAFLEAVGEPSNHFDSPKQILPLISPSVLIIPNSNGTNMPVIHMELNCDWEEEHGMEWIVRADEVLYVGAFNGENPWGDFSTKRTWNYA